MNVSLDEAIEIHAEALRRRHGGNAPHHARRHSERMKSSGDHEGQAVWLRVAERAEFLLSGAMEPLSNEAASSEKNFDV